MRNLIFHSFSSADHIFCTNRRFDLRFPVVHDQYNMSGVMVSSQSHSHAPIAQCGRKVLGLSHPLAAYPDLVHVEYVKSCSCVCSACVMCTP